jgi:2-polyprenyl-3-methyl-5-hydroxy-6-metoxy-1,4-benzoquinol methylase
MENEDQLNRGIPASAKSTVSPSPAMNIEGDERVRIIVVIANYGTGNDVHMRRLLQEFRSMKLQLELHVLTNIPKDWGSGATVHVGSPTRNPRSLPFAHRRLFAEHLDKADYFIYCEDDTLVTEKNIKAFLEVNRTLKSDEIPGFLRVEQLSPEISYIESAHGPYRWLASSLVRRGDWTFAAFTNCHSAFSMASRAQIQKAIASGGFLVDPHIGRFGMLESGASDLYTQCGLTRLICLDRIQDFLLPHLSNKNSLKWGLRSEEFLEQTRALRALEQNGAWKGSLFEVDTKMPRGWWSKNLYALPDPSLVAMIPTEAKTVLSVGTGWGATEEALVKQGKKVTGIPVDGVFGDCLRRRGIEAVDGPFEEAVRKLSGRKFDAVLILDVIHLLANPVQWLSLLKPLVAPGGTVLVSGPRTFDPLRVVWYLRGEPDAVFPRRFADSQVQKVSRARLVKWFASIGMDADVQATCNTPSRIRMVMKLQGLGDRLLSDRLVVRATPRAAV